jgi:inner membrane protein
MASAITHFIVGGALALPAIESEISNVLPKWAIPVSAGLVAVAPDFDTLAMGFFGIPYSSFFGHRGFFHSPFLLLFASAILASIVARRQPWHVTARIAAMWGGCAITHTLLDAMTDGGLGVMLLFPVSAAKLFFPWRPIHVSPLSITRFFDSAGYILRSELPFCVCAIAVGVLGFLARTRSRSASTPGFPRSKTGHKAAILSTDCETCGLPAAKPQSSFIN